MKMNAVLIHGMGRTPLAMSVLAARFRVAGIRPHLFGYSVTIERFEGCVQRLERFITSRIPTEEYIMVGHSLGGVLTRAVLPRLDHKPAACFLLTSPTRACKAARRIMQHPLAKLLGGEIAQLLADQSFMETIPHPAVPTKIYAGTGGPRGRYSPFGEEPNDGVLTLQETLLPGVPVQMVPIIHTFIVTSKVVAQDIVRVAKSNSSSGGLRSY
jgi:pimeloyl-ACP methyl ester carboxylesterase